MSTSLTSGSVPAPARFAIAAHAYFPRSTFIQLSKDGVAEPSTTRAPSSLPRSTAASRAL